MVRFGISTWNANKSTSYSNIKYNHRIKKKLNCTFFTIRCTFNIFYKGKVVMLPLVSNSRFVDLINM